MIEYKYKKRENKFTENGHTMFEFDVLQRLKRLAYLEEQIKQGQLLPIDNASVSSPKIHLVDVDGDIIESLNIMSHAEKLQNAINYDHESLSHHYQVMIRDER